MFGSDYQPHGSPLNMSLNTDSMLSSFLRISDYYK